MNCCAKFVQMLVLSGRIVGESWNTMHVYSASCCFIMIRDMVTYRKHPWTTPSHRIGNSLPVVIGLSTSTQKFLCFSGCDTSHKTYWEDERRVRTKQWFRHGPACVPNRNKCTNDTWTVGSAALQCMQILLQLGVNLIHSQINPSTGHANLSRNPM
jgi:hypothetical protein